MTSFGERFAGLIATSVPESATTYRVVEIDGSSRYLAAATPTGRPALLIRTSDAIGAMPLRLSGIEARYSVNCAMRDAQGERIERLSMVECLASDPSTIGFFCGCMDRLIALVGPLPDIAQLTNSVDRLVAMFRALAQPPRADLIGLVGELCVILAAANAGAAVRSWHSNPTERYDFVGANLRMDVKATTGAHRVHHLSADQAASPKGAVGLLASLKLRPADGGTSVAELIDRVEQRLLGDGEASFKLHEGIALTLGASLGATMTERFDMPEAMASLRYFDLATIPALRAPFPAGISDVRFRVDLEAEPEPSPSAIRARLDPSARGILAPRRRSAQ